MEHLSSCYFCASALETAVERYELPDSQTTVTLCSSCREKLGVVFEATGAEGPSPADDAERAGEQTATALRAGDEHPGQRPGGLTEGSAEDEQADGSDQETDEGAGPSQTGAPDGSGAVGGEQALFEDETELLPEDDPLVEQSGPDRDPDEQPEPTARPDTDESADGDVGPDAESRTGSEEPPQGDDPTGSDQESRAGDDETGGPEPSLTALEYNRVMRILQNREFPVDRSEILTVAASAYDLTEQECAQVIDLAVDRGLLVERDGQLRRPQD